MKYVRADRVFPPELLSEIQKYLKEGIVYFPKPKESHRGWGEASGEKNRLDHRNSEIKDLFRNSGLSHEELAARYHLSVETIKNIVYRK
jgi:Mor family transcriptional regulator